MGTSQNVQAWLKQANTVTPQGDTDAPWPEGMDPGAENNYARSNMSAVKKFAEDTGGALVAGGTSTALTVTTKQVLSSAHITDGLSLAVRTASAATGPATIALDGLAAVAIKKMGGTAIASGDWASGDILRLTYSSAATAFIAENISAASGTPAATASFSVHKNGSDQTISSTAATKLTWATEVLDVGSYFASDKWTPPAGTVLLHAQTVAGGLSSGSVLDLAIYKNGAALKIGASYVGPALAAGVAVTVITTANGTDYFEAYAQSDDSSYVVSGLATATWFNGTMI